MDVGERVVQLSEMPWVGVMVLVVAIFVSWGWLLRRVRRSPLKLPPGPTAWPVVGCLPFLPRVNPPELLFARLAETYGDLMLLRMGARKIVVVSSARMAMEFLKLHDHDFANRPTHIAYQHVSFNGTALIPMSPTNPLFQPTRRMFAAEIASPRKITASEGVRKEQVVKMVRGMVQDLNAGVCVNITKAMSSLVIVLALCMNFGRDYGAKVADETDTLVRTFHKTMHLLIRSSYGNYGDFIPAIRWLDVQGIDAAFRKVKVQLRKSITALIENKKQEMRMWSPEEIRDGANERDIMSKLLSMEGEDRVSDEQLASIVFTLLFAGTDSIYKTITEAIHEVVSHPDMYKRAVDELDTVVGTTRLVQESDIPKLAFLHNVIKETLRLHPPAPTFPPHRNFRPCEVAGYHIPADCSVVINLPPIMRDPSFWDSPLEFQPDRFHDYAKLTTQGSDFHFIPFGYGKHQCPAIGLGMTTVQYVVAVCLQCISWRLPPGLDRSRNVGTTAEPRKKVDLVLEGKLRVHPRLLEMNGTP